MKGNSKNTPLGSNAAQGSVTDYFNYGFNEITY